MSENVRSSPISFSSLTGGYYPSQTEMSASLSIPSSSPSSSHGPLLIFAAWFFFSFLRSGVPSSIHGAATVPKLILRSHPRFFGISPGFVFPYFQNSFSSFSDLTLRNLPRPWLTHKNPTSFVLYVTETLTLLA